MNQLMTIRSMTSEELFALPNFEERNVYLLRGQLIEEPMTRRNPAHSSATAALAHLIRTWAMQQPQPRGRVFDGEASFRLRRDPETNVGIDVAYASAEQVAALTPDAVFVEGPPILAVEVLSPSDKQIRVEQRIEEYLLCGVKQVWIVNPDRRTVMVYRPDQQPVRHEESATIVGDPDLPGLRIRVGDIFAG